MVTQAQPEALVGEPFEDVALVQGTDIPDGAYLVFRAYGPVASDANPTCEVEFFTSKKIPVIQAGVYRSGTTSVDQPGHVYWVETLYNADGTVIAEGNCGAPGETTVVTEGTPETPEKPKPVPLPELPPTLAVTGGSNWWPLLAGGGAVALIAAGVTLWFGRRLALHRERNGYTREEDPGIEELVND